MIRSFLLCGLALASALPTIRAETTNWPRYRGADSDGIGEGASLPESWSERENVVWRTKLPGWGWSSPIVWGGPDFHHFGPCVEPLVFTKFDGDGRPFARNGIPQNWPADPKPGTEEAVILQAKLTVK